MGKTVIKENSVPVLYLHCLQGISSIFTDLIRMKWSKIAENPLKQFDYILTVRGSTEIFLWAPIIVNSTRAKLILLRTESGTVT